MKLMRIGPKGQERPVVMDANGGLRDLSGVVPDFAGAGVSLAAIDAIRALDLTTLPELPAGARIGSCLAGVPNFYCIGLNYARHAAETGARIPAEPILFTKAVSSLSGPNDAVSIPPGSTKSDWEVELGVVIGAPCWQLSEADALSRVAGYCVVNDLSEREWQMERGGQWIKGKSAPGFGPCGPWLVTADDVPDPQALALSLDLNGARVQDSDTSDMIFGVAQIVSYLSKFMELLPGDLISTGTPSGVGLGMKPPRFLRAGDTMALRVEGLGEQRQDVVA
ncbi:2-hydroxyhepta-2,4-diene-1,7-dioate isomerase [Salipiger aestuarii]|uniref:Ureidoglycolate lyase n=1 Tax=Salipiger aestuarii TaxID=568098 RepID=A0A327YGM0_9RHOB|nr:fumarylacetoacetate hydrolase family protein [Salipiger aestuarii]EIE51391.1 fumarylacetoacetate hydrolase family protein [Citreicella sp. 357]KAA8609132.1 2-hydroxyhepta-2,4-diene-1,7-dioate isomerase [Salipiger aestuarii]KAA8614334.1 2-hydroxyhepta-2,4-diene-1,7-dioate isomerase [Salipiger aestuarii]KAB2542822.1 2-hydroxyhepta-2,4-diene-1,7-dioate isomerase [Salipiger aestuarii]RAK20228.1 ureidoglycolate lyase [Salipiger aestuarii]